MLLINLMKALIWALFIAVFALIFGGEFYLQHFIASAGLVFSAMVSCDLSEHWLIRWFNRSKDT